jgi:hypothetical protein
MIPTPTFIFRFDITFDSALDHVLQDLAGSLYRSLGNFVSALACNFRGMGDYVFGPE